jgi:beta-lactamase superfamily II metal-dependent hydrolase
MLKITFLEVGQGDSIIIEWIDNDINKIGIIDCNLKNGNINPTKRYLIKSGYKSIEFMILTHPHTDHFSGFYELLEYCEQNAITINKFYHTAGFSKDHLLALYYAVGGNKKTLSSPKRKLIMLYEKIYELKNANNSILKEVYCIDSICKDVLLNDKYSISILAPSQNEEKEEYLLHALSLSDDKILKIENNPAANLLSTILKISNGSEYVLLTSDCCTKVLSRIANKNIIDYNHSLKFFDIPHHGSGNNHNPEFWINLKKSNKIPAILSVGEGYNHPSESVVEFFDNHFKIYTTNYVGGYASYFDAKRINQTKFMLDFCGFERNESYISVEDSSDVIIEWNENINCSIHSVQ